MNSYRELIQQIQIKTRSKNTSTLYINGPVGSGKSQLLKLLKIGLSEEIEKVITLGPYYVSNGNVQELGFKSMQKLKEAALLDVLPNKNEVKTLLNTWNWFNQQTIYCEGYKFVVLIDLSPAFSSNQEKIGNLFSALRNLEGNLKNKKSNRLLFIVAGRWDGQQLKTYCKSHAVSFPYTSDNYFFWDGVTQEVIKQILANHKQQNAHPIFGDILFELTGGHPKATIEILKHIEPGELSLEKLLLVMKNIAKNGEISKELVQDWAKMPESTRLVIKRLLRRRYLPQRIQDEHRQRLRASGISHYKKIKKDNYLCFRSWFIELVVHFHTEELGFKNDNTYKIDIQELIPNVLSLNHKAYSLVNDIENVARNFVATELCLQENDRFIDFLADWPDISQQVQMRKRNSADAGLSVELNPSLTYISTRKLAKLVQEIGEWYQSQTWVDIGRILIDLANVRNAVMHNQLIDIKSLDRLINLQSKIYKALSEMD